MLCGFPVLRGVQRVAVDMETKSGSVVFWVTKVKGCKIQTVELSLCLCDRPAPQYMQKLNKAHSNWPANSKSRRTA